MILKALYDYYHRMGTLPPQGMEGKEIAYVIVIDAEGRFLRFESKRIDKKRSTTFIVPKSVTRTSAPMPNTLWDNGKYVLGLDSTHEKYYRVFVDRVKEIADFAPHDPSVRALRLFYEQPREEMLSQMSADPLFEEIKTNLGANISFQLNGDDRLIAEKYDIFPPADEHSDNTPEGICLITGQYGPIVRLNTGVFISGLNSPTPLVSFQTKQGYDSYGKTQSYNAPISEEAEFAYSSALKHLLRSDSQNKNKAYLGGRTILFWGSSKASAQVEEGMIDFFEKKDNPNEKVKRVEKLLKSIWSGQIKTLLDDRFYVLGLAPNVGRIAVVTWGDMSLKEFAGNLLRHFDDMDISSPRPVAGIYSMLATVTLGDKISDVQPSLVEAVVSAVMFGTPYPFALYTAALERIRADLPSNRVSPARVAILKAYINRQNKHNKNTIPLTPMLDKDFDNIGYLCGRLAAVLEKIQEDIKRGDSIRTRYLSAASATPGAVFPAMLNLSIHHSENLSEPSRIFYQKLEQEIFSKLPSEGFPAQLNLQDQGRFFVGYYQQRENLFTKKETADTNDLNA